MTDPIHIGETEYKDIDIVYDSYVEAVDSIKEAIPEATDFVIYEKDSFGPLTAGFSVNGVKYWYG